MLTSIFLSAKFHLSFPPCILFSVNHFLARYSPALLRCHTAAITIGDVLTKLTYILVNATFLISLKHCNYFSLRPLLQYVDHLNITQVAIRRWQFLRRCSLS